VIASLQGEAITNYHEEIVLSIEIAQDYETRPGSVTLDRYKTVVDTFRKTE